MPGFLFATAFRWLAAILFVLSVIFGIYYKGRLDERKLFNEYKAEVKAAAMAQEEKTRQIEAKNKRLFKETQDAYNTKLATLRTYYGLRVNGQSGSGLSQVPGASTGIAGAAFDNLPAPAVLAGQCAETTLTLVTLQNWVQNARNNAE